MNNLLHLYNKRKNLRELLPVTEYSLVLFKLPKYAKYFYSRTKGSPLAKFFCVEKYSEFEIEHQTVEMVQGILPN
jgi:acyl-ACP thioesterase